MSRPFTYNDENFTVIGNVLFIHVFLNNAKANEPIVEIPNEIGKRCIQKSALGFLQPSVYNSNGYMFNGIIIHKDNKYYLASSTDINTRYYATAFLFLKDI